MLFGKKDKIRQNKLSEINDKRKQALADAKFVKEVMDTLLYGCSTEEEQVAKINMYKEMQPEIFKEHNAMIKAKLAESGLNNLSKLVDVAKGTTNDALTKIGKLKDTVGKQELLEG